MLATFSEIQEVEELHSELRGVEAKLLRLKKAIAKSVEESEGGKDTNTPRTLSLARQRKAAQVRYFLVEHKYLTVRGPAVRKQIFETWKLQQSIASEETISAT